jgi:hypothetical protein
LAEIVSLNAIRRELSVSQRAMMGARIANLKHGGKRRSRQQTANLQLDLQPAVVTIDKAAALLNVSARSIEMAKEILSEASPEIAARVDSGEITLSKAAKSLRKSFMGKSAGFSSPTPRDLNEHAQWIQYEIRRIYRSRVLDCRPGELLLAMREEDRGEILQKIPALCSWLQRFETEWRERAQHRIQNANRHEDT